MPPALDDDLRLGEAVEGLAVEKLGLPGWKTIARRAADAWQIG